MKDLFLLFSRRWQLISLFYEISDAGKTINFQWIRIGSCPCEQYAETVKVNNIDASIVFPKRAEAYVKSSQTFMIKLFLKIVNG